MKQRSVVNMAGAPCDKVFKLEDILKDKKNETNQIDENKIVKKKNKVGKHITQGVRKSGRFWKNDRSKSSNIVKTRGIKQANKFEKLKKLKDEINRMKTLTKIVVDARNEEVEKKKERRRKNLKRQEENRLKSEIVQVIKNPGKIKKMKRKHLRALEKRDTLFLN